MLRLIGTLARIVFGLTVASIAAGLVTVLFVDIDVLASRFDQWPKTIGQTIDLALLAATHIGIFSSLFVAITAAIGEWYSIRALTYYLLAGIAIALLGFSVQYASEVAGQATIFNNYAIKAFLTVGFMGGFVYWLAAGQFAGRGPAVITPARADDPASTTARTVHTEANENVSVVITHPPSGERKALWRKPKLERVDFSNRNSESHPGEETPEAGGIGTTASTRSN